MRNMIKSKCLEIGVAAIVGMILLLSCGQKLPSDTELFAQAREHEGKQEYNDALKNYELIIDNYAESPIRYKAIFMKGLILQENLKDNKRAVEAFDELLAEYPDCDLADDASVLRDIAVKNGDIMSAFEDSLRQK